MERITKAQITKIWASASGLGLDREMLYLLVPRGSITAMSRAEASELIEYLEELRDKRNVEARRAEPAAAPRPAPVDANAATPEQRNLIYFLLGRLGWLQEPDRARGFLMKYAHVPTVEAIADKQRASAIIEALKAISRREVKAK